MDEKEGGGGKSKKERGGQGRAIALFLTPRQKTPWQAVNQAALA